MAHACVRLQADAATVAAQLVDAVAGNLAPRQGGAEPLEAAARGAACNALHEAARAQLLLARTMARCGASPAATSR